MRIWRGRSLVEIYRGISPFDDNDPDLKEARERHQGYLTGVQQGRLPR